MVKVYTLNHDYEHSGDPERDAFHISFNGDDMISSFLLNPKYEELPDVIYFQANFNLIPEYDYPLTDLNIPVFSRRMMDIILGIGGCKFKEVSVVMIDDTYFKDKFNSKGELLPEVPVEKEYLTFQLQERLEVFDYERSVYKMLKSQPDKPGIIKKMVLKEPSIGFPPLFRIKEKASVLFVSKEAKEALEAENIKGCVFEPVESS